MRLHYFILLLYSGIGQAQIQFTDVAEMVGIDVVKDIYTIGNGISFVDFNNDGLDDLTIGTEKGKPIAFYQNIGGTFERLPALVDHQEEAKQILWVDYNNDGENDLFVATSEGISRLYRNNGNLQLEDVTQQAGLPMQSYFTYGACFGDVDRDGWLDFYMVDHDFDNRSVGNHLFRNNQDGTFSEITTSSNTADKGKIPFCSAFFDFNNDKWPDLFTANDKLTINTLLVNIGQGVFRDVSAITNTNLRMNAMCVAIGDYDNNGWQDIYITNTPVGNALMKNLGSDYPGLLPTFAEVAAQTGTGFYGNGWASNFLDADNDCQLDLYVSGSIPGSDGISSLFYRNIGDGQFEIAEASGLEADTTASFTNAIGDFNQDGFPDIFVQNNPPFKHQLWENKGSNQSWLKIRLQGVLSNRDAVGTKIEAYIGNIYQQRYRHCGIGFLGQNTKTEIIGMDNFTTIDSLVITWPTGHIDRLFNIPANQTLFIMEGSTNHGEIEVDEDIILTVSNHNQNPDITISLFPNPATDQLNITRTSIQKAEYLIKGLQGQLIKKGQLSSLSHSIDVSSLPDQIYTIEIWTEGQQLLSRKWVKQ